MTRLLLDLAWWLTVRGLRFVRAWTGDDAYERYLASRSDSDTAPLSRAAHFAAHLEHKWQRYMACGRIASSD